MNDEKNHMGLRKVFSGPINHKYLVGNLRGNLPERYSREDALLQALSISERDQSMVFVIREDQEVPDTIFVAGYRYNMDRTAI